MMVSVISEAAMKPFLDAVQAHILSRKPPLSKSQIVELMDAIAEAACNLPERDFSQTSNVDEFVAYVIGKAEHRLGWSRTQ